MLTARGHGRGRSISAGFLEYKLLYGPGLVHSLSRVSLALSQRFRVDYAASFLVLRRVPARLRATRLLKPTFALPTEDA